MIERPNDEAVIWLPLSWEESQLFRIGLAAGITSNTLTGRNADEAWLKIAKITNAMTEYLAARNEEACSDD